MDGWITIGTNLDTKDFEREYKRLTKRVLEIGKEQFDIELEIKNRQKVGQDIEDLTQKSAALSSELEEIQLKMGSLVYGRGIQEAGKGSGELSDNLKSAQSSLEKSVKSVGKLVLGIFGAVGAYSLLKRASSELATYDKQYAANLEYIRYVLTQAIAPVLRAIVQLAGTLLQYINLILQGWFGINIFASGSVEAFNKMKKNAGGASKAVKQIKKDLLGFDEINILTDQSDTGTSAGAAGVGIPDISAFEGEVPEWMKWIIDNKDLVLTALAGILGAILALKLGLNGLMGLGIGIAIYGIVMFVRDLIDLINNPSWKQFGKVLKDLGVAITGVGIAIGVLTGGWMVALVGAIIALVGVIIENWDTIKEVLGKVGQWIYDHVIKPTIDFFTKLWDDIMKAFDAVKNWIVKTFGDIWNSVTQIFGGAAEWFGGIFNGAWQLIQQAFSGIVGFFSGIWNNIVTIFSNIGVKIGEGVSGAFKAAVNAVFSTLERILNAPIRAINGLISVINAIPGINLGKLSTFNLPRLAVGGIVNMPNTGTLVGGAIAGESGREGVIPLTDTQAMAQLGREIGRWITVNANITNSMNGRVISRELKQIQNEQDFAYNT